jgi:predicted TIM-barrel fold metal-dependent hydrolase
MIEGKIVDVDGHVLEPPDLWQQYLESKYRDRAIRIEKDSAGVEYLVVEGQPMYASRGIGVNGPGIGQPCNQIWRKGADHFGYQDGPRGGYDPQARVQVLDEEGIDAALLYPSLGLMWEAVVNDPELLAAYCRAYNNWLCDFCQPYPDRLIPIAHISLRDVEAAVTELKRVAKRGMKGVMLYPYAPNGRPLWDQCYDPFWAEAQTAGLPIGLHVAATPNGNVQDWVPPAERHLNSLYFWHTMIVSPVADVQNAFAALFQGAVFDRFPTLRIVLLETGAGWIAHLLERMDAKYNKLGFLTGLKHLPSEYFKRQCWISFDPDETTLPALVQRYGAEKFFWASDYPHFDAVLGAVPEVKERIVSLPAAAQRRILGDNVVEVYNLH